MELIKKKILVLGATGTIGNCIFSYLGKNTNLEIFGTTTKKSKKNNNVLNYTITDNNFQVIYNYIKKYNIDYVINCIGIIRPNANNIKDIQNTFLVNSLFPKSLAFFCDANNIKMIHISTDCVFDGKKGLYLDTDLPNELGFYGLSKSLGEVTFLQNITTIRTSIVGHELQGNQKNLLSWFLSLKDKEEIYGYSKSYWNGITTLLLSMIIERIIINEINISGLLHLGSYDSVSKNDLLYMFNKIYKRKVIIKFEDTTFIDRRIIPSKEQELFKDMIEPIEKQIHLLKEYYTNDKNIF